MEDNFSMDGLESGRCFPDYSSALYLLCTLFLLLLHRSTSDHQALDPGGWGPTVYNTGGQNLVLFNPDLDCFPLCQLASSSDQCFLKQDTGEDLRPFQGK